MADDNRGWDKPFTRISYPNLHPPNKKSSVWLPRPATYVGEN